MATSDKEWIRQQKRAWGTTFVSYPNDYLPPNVKTGMQRAAYTGRTSTGFSSESLNYFLGASNRPAEYQYGYRAGVDGVSFYAPESTATQNYFYDPATKLVVPLTQAGADAVAAGTAPTPAQLLGGSASSPDSNGRVDIPGVYDPATGIIGSLDPVATEKKFADSKAAALKSLLDSRAASGNLSALTDLERQALEQQAEQQAVEDMSVYIGLNPDNYPKSVAGPLATPTYKAGQIFPTFDSAGPRELTPEEARTLNFIRNSGVVPDSSSVLARLFDPRVPDEEKRTILAQASGAYAEYSVKAPTAQDQWQGDDWYWSWNPIEMAGQVLLKGVLEPLTVAYNDFIIPSYTWTASALPGGVRTASWDEARSVAPGQMTAAILGPRGSTLVNGTLQMAGSTIGAVAEGVGSGNWDNLMKLSKGYSDALIYDQAAWKDLGDSVYNEALREAAFVDDYYGSQISGGIGLAVNIIWDPLWLAGPIGKGVRVSHMLGMGARAITNQAEAARFVTALDRGAAVNRSYDLATKAVDAARRSGNADNVALAERILADQEVARQSYLRTASPIEQFADWVVRSKPSAAQIMEHNVIRFGADAERALVLSKASTFEEASLILKAGLGDPKAIDDLKNFSIDTASKLEDLRIQGQIDNIATSPDNYVKVWSLLERDLDNSLRELRRLEDEALYSINPERTLMEARESALTKAYDLRDAAILRLNNATDIASATRAQSEVDAATNRISDLLFDIHSATRAVPEEVRAAQAQVQRNLEKINGLRNAHNFAVRTPEAIELAGRQIDELFRQDEMLRLALESESPWLWNSKQVSFGSPGARLEGMARWREQVRQRKAVRRADQKASHRQGTDAFREGGWVRETYKRGTNTVSVWKFLPAPVKGASAVAADALTRPFTYAAMESPAGYMNMTRGAVTDQDREARAILDNMKVYSGGVDDGTFTTVSRREANLTDGRQTIAEQTVTAQVRKNDVLDRFLRNSAMSPERAVRVFEQDILADLARKYRPGGEADAAWFDDIRAMYAHFDAERSSLINQVQTRGYWVDENFNKHVSPYLESQLAQGVPMIDFRRLEKLIRNYSKKGRDFGKYRAYAEGVQRSRVPYNRAFDELQTLTKGTPEYRAKEREVSQYRAELERALKEDAKASAGGGTRLWENGLKWYDEFQVLWRASVLFRLGYPTRNVIDGTIRRIAYDASVVPVLQDAVRGSRNLASNVREGRVRDDLPFEWMNRAARRRKERLGEVAKTSVDAGRGLPPKAEKWRNREMNRLVDFRQNVADRKAALDEVIEELRTGPRGHLSPDEIDALDVEVVGLVDHARSLETNLRQLDHRMASISNDADAVISYRQSLDQPRRIGDEYVFGVDGSVYYGMMGDPRMGNILRDQVSAGETVQASLGLSLDISRSVHRAVTIQSGGTVGPGAANYYEAVSYAVNNYVRNGLLGRLWAQGVDPDKAATILMRREGERFRTEIGPNFNKAQRDRLEGQLSDVELAQVRAVLDADDAELDTALRQFMGAPAKGAEGATAMLPTELVDQIRQARKDWRKIRGKSEASYARRDAKAGEITALERQLGRRMRDHRILVLDDQIRQAERELSEIQGLGLADPLTAPASARSVYAERTFFEATDEAPTAGLRVITGEDTRLQDAYTKVNDLRAQRARLTETRPFAPSDDLNTRWFQANGIDDYDQALDAVRQYFADFDRLIPNPAVRRAIADGQVTPEFLRANLRAEEWDLFPVSGAEMDIASGAGRALSVVEKINPGINKVYQLIGAMPEDTLVRIPFAANVYKEQLRVMSAWLDGAFPDGRIPAWAVEAAERNARQTAVRETKRYMYTQDRRTNFGRVMERVVPFVSAWQNSVIAFSRMAKMNPEVLPWFEQAWRAPDTIGLTDQDGNIRIPMSAGLAPLGSWLGGDELVFRKQSLFVLPDQFDPMLTFKAGPVIQVAASNLMQANLIGPVVPKPLKAALKGMGLDDSQAQQVWDLGARLTFGTDQDTGRPTPPSTIPLSLDKALPPWLQKGVQLVQSGFGNTPENNALYATQYSRIIREETLRYARGERDDLPDRDEVRVKANALYLARISNNLLGITAGPLGAITPPSVDSDAFSLQETYRLLVDTVGYDQADEAWASMFGDEALLLANFSGTKSPGGMPVSVDALARAEEYAPTIAAIAGGMDEANLGMLAYLLTDGTYQQEDYAPDVRAAQLTRSIPGTNVPWREVLTPQEQTRNASIATGWSMYTHTMDAIYAEMNARGLKSLNSAGAAPLRQARDEFIERMRTDPLYTQWHDDYQNGGERRLGGALDFLRSVLADDGFVSGPGANEQDMWQTAALWLNERRNYYASVGNIKTMDGYQGNDYASGSVRDAWLTRSTQIAETNPRFYQFWVRYLENDDLTMD